MTEKGWVDYFGVVVSRKAPIMAFTLVCALAAGIGYFVMPKTYESGLTMEVGIFSDVMKRTGSSEETTTEPIEPVQVVRDSITSKPFMAEVIDRLKLDITPDKLKKKVKAVINEDLRDGSGSINRQIIISTKSETPDRAKSLAETVAGIIIEKHGKIYGQAMANRYKYEDTLKEQIADLGTEVETLRKMLLKASGNARGETASLVLLQANMFDKERHIAELKRELSQAQLLDNTNMKSANTRVSVPAYLPQTPSLSWKMYVIIGLVVGFLLSSGYYAIKEAVAPGSGD